MFAVLWHCYTFRKHLFRNTCLKLLPLQKRPVSDKKKHWICCAVSVLWNSTHIACHRVWIPVATGHGGGRQIWKEADTRCQAAAEVTDQWTARRRILCRWRWIHWRVAQQQEARWSIFVCEIPTVLKTPFSRDNLTPLLLFVTRAGRSSLEEVWLYL